MGIVVFALEVLNALILFGNWENEPYKKKKKYSKQKNKTKFQKWSDHVVLYQKHNVTL